MIFYLSIFLSSSLFAYLADNKVYKFGERKYKKINTIFAFLAVCIPCYIAAVRSSTIGYDVTLYGDYLFEMAQKYTSFFKFNNTFSFEVLFQALAYFSAKFGNKQVYYFLIQLFTIGPIYASLRRETKKYSWLGLLIYFFWLFPFSLNIMRQSISIGLLIWGYSFLKEEKTYKYIILVLVSMGFHSMGIIGIIIYCIHYVTVCNQTSSRFRKKVNSYSNVTKLMITTFTIVTVLFSQNIIYLISTATGRYANFALDTTRSTAGFDIIYLAIVLLIEGVLIYLIPEKTDKEHSFFIFVIFIGLVLYQLQMISSQMYRVGTILTSYMILGVPKALARAEKSNKIKTLIIGCVLLILLFYFYNYIVRRGWHSVFPYQSEILGI